VATVRTDVKLALPLSLALLAAPCAQQEQSVRVSTAASKALGSPEDACRTAPVDLPAFRDELGGDLDGGAWTGRPDTAAPRPVFQSHPLLPPDKPGESASEVLGCLSGDEHTLVTGARWPPPDPNRPQEAVRVNPLSSGLLITHELAHPCCLRVKVSAAVSGGAVRVSETLEGAPCACRCASRLRTAVALAPGRYPVSVVVRGPGPGERKAYSGEAALPGK
jgi:hypothetical protein